VTLRPVRHFRVKTRLVDMAFERHPHHTLNVLAFERLALSILACLTVALLVPVVIGVSILTFVVGALAGCLVGIMVYRLPRWH
jgi:hypothetical protein